MKRPTRDGFELMFPVEPWAPDRRLDAQAKSMSRAVVDAFDAKAKWTSVNVGRGGDELALLVRVIEIGALVFYAIPEFASRNGKAISWWRKTVRRVGMAQKMGEAFRGLLAAGHRPRAIPLSVAALLVLDHVERVADGHPTLLWWHENVIDPIEWKPDKRSLEASPQREYVFVLAIHGELWFVAMGSGGRLLAQSRVALANDWMAADMDGGPLDPALQMESTDDRPDYVIDGVNLEFGMSFPVSPVKSWAYEGLPDNRVLFDEPSTDPDDESDGEESVLGNGAAAYIDWSESWGSAYANRLAAELERDAQSVRIRTNQRHPDEAGGPGIETDTIVLILATVAAYPALKEVIRDLRAIRRKLRSLAGDVTVTDGVAWLLAWEALADTGVTDGSLVSVSPIKYRFDYYDEVVGYQVTFKTNRGLMMVSLSRSGDILGIGALPNVEMPTPPRVDPQGWWWDSETMGSKKRRKKKRGGDGRSPE